MKKRILAMLLSSAMIIGMMAGCATTGTSKSSDNKGKESDDGKVTLTFLNKYPEDPYAQYFEDAVAEFEKENRILILRWRMFLMKRLKIS